MKKVLLLFVFCGFFLSVSSQVNTNSFNFLSPFGDLSIKRGISDSNFKRALATINTSGNNYQLNINYAGDFTSGVRIQGSSTHIDGKLGIGINPSDILDIGNKGFSFHNGGHQVLSFKQNANGDLDVSKYSAQIRFVPSSGQFSLGVSSSVNSSSVPRILVVNKSGKVGVRTANPDATLTVNGDIHAKEVKVDLNIPADYVFEKYYTGSSTLKEDYTMLTLEEVASFTKKNNHLPGVPSAQEIQENGLLLKEMTNLLLQKIEELTLYTIEQENRIKLLESEIKKLN